MGPFRLYFGMVYGYIVPKSVYIEPFLAIVGKKWPKQYMSRPKKRALRCNRGTFCFFYLVPALRPLGSQFLLKIMVG